MSYDSTILADGPIGFWKLSESIGATSFADSSGNGLTGTVDVASTAPVFGSTGVLPNSSDTAVHFAGRAAGLSILRVAGVGAFIDDTAGQSLEFWTHISADSDGGIWSWFQYGPSGVVPYNGAYRSSHCQYPCFSETARHDTFDGEPLNVDGELHHVVYTRLTGGNFKYYVDGILVGTVAAGTYSHTANLLIGGDDVSGDPREFTGELGRVSLWNKELSQAQVTAHYLAGLTPYRAAVMADSPWAFYPMAADFTDVSGNERDLSVASGTVTTGNTNLCPGDTGGASAHFDGSSYLGFATSSNPGMTLEYWVEQSAHTDYTIAGDYPDYSFGVSSAYATSAPYAIATGGSSTGAVYGSSGPNISDGSPHHVVMAWADADTVVIYVDGSAISQTGTMHRVHGGGGSFGGFGGTPWLTGNIQNLAIYDGQLSAARVLAHYDAGTGAGGVNLVRTAADGLSEVADSSGRLMALGRAFGDLLSAIADFAVNFGTNVSLTRTAVDTTPVITDAAAGTVTTGVALVRTAHDTIPIISDTARRVVIESLQAQFHPEIVFKSFDLNTLEYFGTLPLDGVTFQCRYNSLIGTLQGTLALDPAPNPLPRPEAIRLRRMLIVEINEWPAWVGVIDRLNWDSDSSLYQFRASELWGLFDAWPLVNDRVYPDIEQIAIYQDLMNNDVAPFVLPSGCAEWFVTSDIHRNEAIIGSANMLFGNFVRAHGISIFDGYQIRGPRVVYLDASQTPYLVLEAASPTLGHRYDGINTPRFRYLPQGGEIIKVTWADDAAVGAGYATTIFGTSILSGNPAPAPLTAVSENTALISAGWPRVAYVLPAVQDYTQGELQARCDAEKWRRALVYGAPSVTITLAAYWQSRLLPGDDAVLVLQDNLRWPVKTTLVYRVTEIEVDVEAETATLTFDPSSVAILTAYGPELADEALTQMPGTTNQNPSNGPGQDTGGSYYPPIIIGPPNLPIGYPPPPTTPPPFTALLYRANQDSLAGSTVSFGSPTYSGSGTGLVARLPGATQVAGQSIWFNTDWSGSIMGTDIPVTLDLVWTSSILGVVARTRVTVEARSDGPSEFSLAVSYSAWSYNPLVGDMVPSLEVAAAAGSWTITHLDAEFLISTLAQ